MEAPFSHPSTPQTPHPHTSTILPSVSLTRWLIANTSLPSHPVGRFKLPEHLSSTCRHSGWLGKWRRMCRMRRVDIYPPLSSHPYAEINAGTFTSQKGGGQGREDGRWCQTWNRQTDGRHQGSPEACTSCWRRLNCPLVCAWVFCDKLLNCPGCVSIWHSACWERINKWRCPVSPHWVMYKDSCSRLV